MNKKNKINKPVKSALATKVSLRTKMLLVAVMLISFSVGLSFFGVLVKTFSDAKTVEIKPGATYTATATLSDKMQNGKINWSTVERTIATQLTADGLKNKDVAEKYLTIINSAAWAEYKKYVDQNGVASLPFFEEYARTKISSSWICSNSACGVVGIGQCGNACLGGKLNPGTGEWELKLVVTF